MMGNDDWVELDSSGLQVQSIHRRLVEWRPFNLVGYQFSPPFMGGIFKKPEEEIAAALAATSTTSMSPLTEPGGR
jgi:hypothetical protein